MNSPPCPTCDSEHPVDEVAAERGPFPDSTAVERFAAAMDDTMRARVERDR
jgi:hypothetical protein